MSDYFRTLFHVTFSDQPERREKEQQSYIYILLIILKNVKVCGMLNVPTFCQIGRLIGINDLQCGGKDEYV